MLEVRSQDNLTTGEPNGYKLRSLYVVQDRTTWIEQSDAVFTRVFTDDPLLLIKVQLLNHASCTTQYSVYSECNNLRRIIVAKQ